MSRPRVLDEPIVLSVLSSVTNSQHSMSLVLDSRRARRIIKHSLSIEQEVLVHSHSHRDGTHVSNSILQLLNGEGSGQHVVSDLDSSSCLVEVAPAINTQIVTVGRILHQTAIVKHPTISTEIFTSITAIITKVP